MKRLVFYSVFLLAAISLTAQNKGQLVIIGGGSIPEYITGKFVEAAGGNKSKFVIIPMASAEPLQSANSFAKKLLTAGCSKIEFLISSKEEMDADSNFAKLKDATGVFFTGGDQSKLTNVLLGTKLLDMIKALYKKGAAIGGTSAGAAVMSSIMITGQEIINKDSTNAYNVIKKGNIKTAEGFGFIQNTIIDQHFIKRKRMNRLVSLVLENPELLGIGIDESTAIIVKPNKTFEVLGESLVNVFNASKAKNISLDKNSNQAVKDISMSLLKSGDIYTMPKSKLISKGNSK